MKADFFSIGPKILLVNLVAPILLIGGFLLLGGYRDELVKMEFKNLELNAELISIHSGNNSDIIDNLSKISDIRVQIFSANGTLIADSRSPSGVKEQMVSLDALIDTLTQGDVIRNISFEEGIIDIMTPVYEGYDIIGAVRLYASTDNINRSIGEVKRGIVIMFIIALIVTVLLSVFLAKTIIYPLNQLAVVAAGIEERGKITDIPDFSNRRDEIGRLSSALNTMLGLVAKRLEEFENFASDVSHEVKNPLTSILSAIETVQKISDESKKEKLLGIIFEDVKRLDRLITDISTVSKATAQMADEPLEKIAPVALIGKFVEAYSLEYPDHKLVFSHSKRADRSFIIAKDTRVMQVLHNLVNNAASFSPSGSEITMNADVLRGDFILTVADQGRGIPEGNEEQIFSRFYCDRDGKERQKHSGLGLAISRVIIEGLSGDIRASHNSPKGAVFTIKIPVVE